MKARKIHYMYLNVETVSISKWFSEGPLFWALELGKFVLLIHVDNLALTDEFAIRTSGRLRKRCRVVRRVRS